MRYNYHTHRCLHSRAVFEWLSIPPIISRRIIYISSARFYLSKASRHLRGNDDKYVMTDWHEGYYCFPLTPHSLLLAIFHELSHTHKVSS